MVAVDSTQQQQQLVEVRAAGASCRCVWWRLQVQPGMPFSFLLGAFCTLAVVFMMPSSTSFLQELSGNMKVAWHGTSLGRGTRQLPAHSLKPATGSMRMNSGLPVTAAQDPSRSEAQQQSAAAVRSQLGASGSTQPGPGSIQDSLAVAARTTTAAPPAAAAHPPAIPTRSHPNQLRLPWDPLLTQKEVQRGLSFYGSGARMQALAGKLLAGKPIKAFALGGSVTFGKGASNESMNYASQFFNFINTTFPHRDHVLSNKGLGATSSGIFAACTEHMVEQDGDLFVLEFTVNDGADLPFEDPQRKGYEQLVRKLLALPHQPAIIQLHHYAWWQSVPWGLQPGVYHSVPAEAQLSTFAQYYDFPAVSLRGAVYPLMQAGIPGFKVDGVREPSSALLREGMPHTDKKHMAEYFYFDKTHPADGGYRVLAELLAAVVLRAAGEVVAAETGRVSAFAAAWPTAARADARLASLPPPMIAGNEVAATTLCAILEAFKALVVAHSGFEYRAERPDAVGFAAQKWGWSAYNPGDWAEMEFDSRASAQEGSSMEAGSKQDANMLLTYLRSYSGGMGTAAVTCVSGCSCSKTVLDGTWEVQASLQQVHKVKVTQHPRCRIRVQVREQAGEAPQQGHKVVLTGFMLSHFPIKLRGQTETAELAASRMLTPS